MVPNPNTLEMALLSAKPESECFRTIKQLTPRWNNGETLQFHFVAI